MAALMRASALRRVLPVTRLDRPLQLAASILTIDPSEVCNPPRGIVGYSVLCAAWRLFIISNHSIEPGWGMVGTGCGLLRSAASAYWREYSKMPELLMGGLSISRAPLQASTSSSCARSG